MDRTREFIRQAQEGNQEAKEILLQENTGLIWNIVKRFYGRGYDPEDLYQIGAIGLLKCIDNFDFTYDVKFSTYAVPMIMGEIRRFCRDDGMLKVSRTLKTLAAQAAQMREKMTKDLGRDITLQELADGLGIALEELLPALEATKDVESLSASLFEGENGKKTELEEDLDRSLKHALRHRKYGKNLHYIPHNCEIGAKTGDDVQTFVRQWAEKNDVHLFVLDWGKLDLDYINDYENGLLKDLSAPKTVMYLENFTGIEFKKRYLVSNVYRDCVAGGFCKPAPNFLFAIAISSSALPISTQDRFCSSFAKTYVFPDSFSSNEASAS